MHLSHILSPLQITRTTSFSREILEIQEKYDIFFIGIVEGVEKEGAQD